MNKEKILKKTLRKERLLTEVSEKLSKCKNKYEIDVPRTNVRHSIGQQHQHTSST